MKILIKDLIYIAGFFDGEGCISGKTRMGHPTVRVAITQQKTEVLYWIKETLEMGEVLTTTRGTSSWRINSKEDIGRFINLILPYCKVKREQLIVGQRLINLIGKPNHRVGLENHQGRMMLFNQLKKLKR